MGALLWEGAYLLVEGRKQMNLTKELLIEMITDELNDQEVARVARSAEREAQVVAEVITSFTEQLVTRLVAEEKLIDEEDDGTRLNCAECWKRFLISLNSARKAMDGKLGVSG